MISILKQYDEMEALGILARAALSITLGEDNPSALPKIDGEIRIRETIFEHFREKLSISNDDYSGIAIEKICDAIDAESDNLIEPIDYGAALKRLSESGRLPSDLLTVELKDNEVMEKFFGDGYEHEMYLIRDTIKNYDMEHHCEPLVSELNIENHDASLLSLFAKHYSHGQSRADNFVMLVIGQKNFSIFTVNFAVRIYDFALIKSKNLMDMLKGFVKKFGNKISVNGKTGFFFLDSYKQNTERNIRVNTPSNKSFENVFVEFTQSIYDSVFYVSFGIDLKKYKKSLRQHHFKFLPIESG